MRERMDRKVRGRGVSFHTRGGVCIRSREAEEDGGSELCDSPYIKQTENHPLIETGRRGLDSKYNGNIL